MTHRYRFRVEVRCADSWASTETEVIAETYQEAQYTAIEMAENGRLRGWSEPLPPPDDRWFRAEARCLGIVGDDRAECPACGSRGPHDDNGTTRVDDRTWCCACGEQWGDAPDE